MMTSSFRGSPPKSFSSTDSSSHFNQSHSNFYDSSYEVSGLESVFSCLQMNQGKRNNFHSLPTTPVTIDVFDQNDLSGVTSPNYNVSNRKNRKQNYNFNKWSSLENECEENELKLENMIQKSSHSILMSPDQAMALLNLLQRVKMEFKKKLEEGLSLCAFCRNNRAPNFVYLNHKLRDEKGRISCPTLRRISCPQCGATGDFAHTIKYCTEKSNF
ncbi:hypothetical protein Ciccas_000912 [Cichlidogyrus casuarinus]|uniref:Nanos-type domain-containing protein n=1 Tax=Cichlidogyrus casuarinus TaxID=1844966 RepID=A0ABD2QPI6_9PLAT